MADITRINDIIAYEGFCDLPYDKEKKEYNGGDIFYHFTTSNDGTCITVEIGYYSDPDIYITKHYWDYDTVRQWLSDVFNERTKTVLQNYWYARKGFTFENGKI